MIARSLVSRRPKNDGPTALIDPSPNSVRCRPPMVMDGIEKTQSSRITANAAVPRAR